MFMFVILSLGLVIAMNAKASGSDAVSSNNQPDPNFSLSNLPDTTPENQGGDFDTTYDSEMWDAHSKTGVPFALIKAHAIRESSLKSDAYHFDNSSEGGSYGLMQVEYNYGDNRFSKYGYPDSAIGEFGDALKDPGVNCYIGACIIRDNLEWLKNLRDAVNAYNTGVKEGKREAPANYVNDVLGYYSTISGKELS